MIRKIYLLFSSTLFLIVFVQAQDPPDFFPCATEYETIEHSNPIMGRTCDCAGHLWVNPGCMEGYLCFDISGFGCHIQCPEDTILLTSSVNRQWACWDGEGMRPIKDADQFQKNQLLIEGQDGHKGIKELASLNDERQFPVLCPVNGYETCPNVEPAVPPTSTPSKNPLGLCHCDDEFWMADGCSYGWRCDADTLNSGGEYLICPNNDILMFNFTTGENYCDPNPANCPGKGFNTGCPTPVCLFGKNSIGTCECDKELFIGPNCSTGFYCMENIPDPWINEGCKLECLDNQHVVPHFSENYWECVDITEESVTCPGQFHIQCEKDAFPNSQELDASYCDCEVGQFIVSPDCRHGFYCHSRMPNYGSYHECPENYVLSIDRDFWRWSCSYSISNDCPGAGGFKIGCSEGSPVPPDFLCNYRNNDIGNCDGCDNQLFVNHGCTTGFLCTDQSPIDAEGCALDCPAGEQVHFDPYRKDWRCADESEVVCPGAFHTDCPDEFGNIEITCGCRNEVWVNRDCSSAFVCDGPQQDGFNSGKYHSCEVGEIVYVDWDAPQDLYCVLDEGQCPGAFHFGCDPGEIPTTSSSTTTTTTSSTTTSTTTTSSTTTSTTTTSSTTTSTTTSSTTSSTTTSTTTTSSTTSTTTTTSTISTSTTTSNTSGVTGLKSTKLIMILGIFCFLKF